jgi:hypothetical protein
MVERSGTGHHHGGTVATERENRSAFFREGK